MRDVNAGWAVRYTHANVASFFFIFVYLHIARGLYYSSYKSPRILVWTIGVIILVLMMAIAFLGYTHSPKWFNAYYIYVDFNDIPTLSLSVLPTFMSLRLHNILSQHNIKGVTAWENLHVEGVKQVGLHGIRPLNGTTLRYC